MTKNYRSYLKVAGALFGAVSLLILLAGGVIYARTTQHPSALIANADSESFYDDLTVESDEVYSGDVILYAGDLHIEQGGRIEGALVVYSGDITIEEGAAVAGDVVGASGDAWVAGHIGGNLVIWSGDITLEESAVVDGDVSVMSGDIRRERSAVIGGSIVAGPKLPDFPAVLESLQLNPAKLPMETAVAGAVSTSATVPAGTMDPLVRFVLRLIAASFFTAIVVFITGVIYYLKPSFVGRIRTTLTTQRPVSFIIGLLLNLLLTMLMLLVFSSQSLFLALCLAPVSLLALLLFLVLNTGGWAALSLTAGERILTFAKMSTTQPIVTLLTGATVMTGTLAFVWALGGGMRPVAYIAMLVLTALGGGALIVQQFNKQRGSGDDADGSVRSDDQPVMV